MKYCSTRDKKLNFDVWYNETNGMILKVSYSKTKGDIVIKID